MKNLCCPRWTQQRKKAFSHLFGDRDELFTGIVPIQLESCFILQDTAKRMVAALQEDPSAVEDVMRSLRSLIATADALRESFLSQANHHTSLRTKVMDYLHLHLFEPIMIDDVCQHFGLNRLYLTNLFRKWTGQGIRGIPGVRTNTCGQASAVHHLPGGG